MGLKLKCDKCAHELDTQGALIFGPPLASGEYVGAFSQKIHLCVDCYDLLEKWLHPQEP